MRLPALLSLVAAALAGCAAAPTPTIRLGVDLTAAEVAWAMAPGKNTIKGNAFMRQRGGGVVTCAGQDVRLTPVSLYSEQRIRALYGNTMRGAAPPRQVVFEPNPPAYYQATQLTKCDSQGNFTFENVPDGDWFAVAVVSWTVGYGVEGGGLMHRYEVRGGQTVTKVLSP